LKAAPAGTPAPFVGSVPYIPGPGNKKHPPPPVHVSNQSVTAATAVPAEPRPEFSEDDFKQVKFMVKLSSGRNHP